MTRGRTAGEIASDLAFQEAVAIALRRLLSRHATDAALRHDPGQRASIGEMSLAQMGQTDGENDGTKVFRGDGTFGQVAIVDIDFSALVSVTPVVSNEIIVFVGGAPRKCTITDLLALLI